MPTRDDDDNLEVPAGLSADRDDARYRGRTAAADASVNDAGTRAKRRTINRSERQRPSWFYLGGMILLFALMVGLGFWSFQLQGQLADSQRAVAALEKRLNQLNQQVFATDSSVSETGTTIEKKFKFFDSEIRTLWDVSNKRNKAAIQSNSDTLRQLGKEVKAVAGQLKTRDTQLARLNKEQAAMQKQQEQLERSLSAEATTLRAGLEGHTEQLLLLRGELELMQNRLQQMSGDVASRLTTNEEAIEAIDAARRQLFANITRLQKRLDQLQGGG